MIMKHILLAKDMLVSAHMEVPEDIKEQKYTSTI